MKNPTEPSPEQPSVRGQHPPVAVRVVVLLAIMLGALTTIRSVGPLLRTLSVTAEQQEALGLAARAMASSAGALPEDPARRQQALNDLPRVMSWVFLGVALLASIKILWGIATAASGISVHRGTFGSRRRLELLGWVGLGWVAFRMVGSIFNALKAQRFLSSLSTAQSAALAGYVVKDLFMLAAIASALGAVVWLLRSSPLRRHLEPEISEEDLPYPYGLPR